MHLSWRENKHNFDLTPDTCKEAIDLGIFIVYRSKLLVQKKVIFPHIALIFEIK